MNPNLKKEPRNRRSQKHVLTRHDGFFLGAGGVPWTDFSPVVLMHLITNPNENGGVYFINSWLKKRLQFLSMCKVRNNREMTLEIEKFSLFSNDCESKINPDSQCS